MKFRTIKTAAMLLLAGVMLWQNGCGGSTVNQIIDTVAPASALVIAGTVQTFSSTVTGSTTTTSTFACTYSYTPLPTTAQPNPKAVTGPCTSGMSLNGGTVGTWTDTPTAATNVLTYTAPTLSNFPNPIPQLTFTATADADKKKTGTTVITLDSGIRVSVTPTTATVPVGLSPAQQVQFTASFLNAPPVNPSPTWAVMQPVAGDPTDFPNGLAPTGATCSPNCGTISAQGVFTAPATMPTDTFPKTSGSNAASSAKTVYVVANSPSDTAHFAVVTITLVDASTNPITFTGIHPTTIAAGGILQDIFLDAKNILNTTTITFTPPGSSQTPQAIAPSNVFTVPITAAYCTPTTTLNCDASIVTRVRLGASQLANAGTAQITVNNIPDTGQTVAAPCTKVTGSGSTINISCPLNLIYASPGLVAAVPDSYPQGTSSQFSTDGGYYGGGSSPIVNLLFNGNLNIASAFGPRKFTGPLEGSQTQSPGLYPVSIVSNAPQGGQPPFNPPPYPVVTTNVAVQPVFANALTPGNITLPAAPGGGSLAPSSIAVNSTEGLCGLDRAGRQ